MLTNGISFLGFKDKRDLKNIKIKFQKIIQTKSDILDSLGSDYKYSYKKKKLNKYKKSSNFRIIGMGGSILGTKTIYEFLKHKIKKKFLFIDNLQNNSIKFSKKIVNLVVSKSGNTTETIVNSNILIKKKDKNIFITENKKNYLYLFAEKLKSDIIITTILLEEGIQYCQK